MTLSVGLSKTVKALKPLSSANPVEAKSYEAIGLLDAFLSEGDYYLVKHPGTKGNESHFELIPGSSEAYAVKSKLDTVLAELTANQRHTRTEMDYDILRDAGYPLRVSQLSVDEWEVRIRTRRGELSSRFIEA